MRDGAPRIVRARRHNTMVGQSAAESELGFVGHRKDSLSIASRRETAASPSQKLPSTAIYCHFGATKPLRPLESFQAGSWFWFLVLGSWSLVLGPWSSVLSLHSTACERSKDEPRRKVAIQRRLSHGRRIDQQSVNAASEVHARGFLMLSLEWCHPFDSTTRCDRPRKTGPECRSRRIRRFQDSEIEKLARTPLIQRAAQPRWKRGQH